MQLHDSLPLHELWKTLSRSRCELRSLMEPVMCRSDLLDPRDNFHLISAFVMIQEWMPVRVNPSEPDRFSETYV